MELPFTIAGINHWQMLSHIGESGWVESGPSKLKAPTGIGTCITDGEALAIKWSDFKNNVLHVTRRIYEGDMDTVKSKRSDRKLPIDPILMTRIEKFGKREWVFRSKTGGPLNPGNALKRHVRPAAKKLGISLGGWHDFRHTLSTKLRRSGVHPKVVSDILGHNKVNLAMDVYDRTELEDFVQPLSVVSTELLRNVTKNAVTG